MIKKLFCKLFGHDFEVIYEAEWVGHYFYNPISKLKCMRCGEIEDLD